MGLFSLSTMAATPLSHTRPIILSFPTTIIFTLFLSLLLLFAPSGNGIVTSAAASVSPQGPLICMVNFGFVTDLGFTHQFNKGHREFFTWFKQTYPLVLFRTHIVHNGYFRPDAEKAAMGMDLVNRGCRAIVIQSSSLEIGDVAIARQFPNISIFRYNYLHKFHHQVQAPNHRFFNQPQDRAFAIVGAAAAHYASTCIGFIAAFEDDMECERATNGFILGARSVNATIPVHVVTMQSWYRPDDEVHATDLLLSMGCEVVGRYIDSQSTNVAVSTWEAPLTASVIAARKANTARIHLATVAAARRQPLSTASQSDNALFVGDTVLTSAYNDWLPPLKAMLLPVLLNDTIHPVPPFFVNASQYLISRESSLAVDININAIEASIAARFGANESVYCGTITRRDGTVFLQPGNQCMNASSTIGGYITGATVHPSPFPDAASCPAGRFPLFTTAPLITMRCEQCPAGTFSAGGKQLQCLPCGTSKISDAGASECRDPPSFTQYIIIGVVVGALVVAIAGLAAVLLWRTFRARRDLSCAPKDADVPFAIAFTDIESSTTLWARAPQAMSGAVDVHHRVLREAIRAHRGYEVKTIGDAFMVAFKHVEDAVLFATDAQLRLHDADWGPTACAAIDGVYRDMTMDAEEAAARDHEGSTTPAPPQIAFEARQSRGLRVRIGVNYGTGTIAFDPTTQAYDYYGTVVNMAARIESVGHGGQVVASEAVIRAAFPHDSPPTAPSKVSGVAGPAVKHGAAYVAAFGPQHLRGLDAPVNLFQLAAVADKTAGPRLFPPLRIERSAGDLTPLNGPNASVKGEGDTASLMGSRPSLIQSTIVGEAGMLAAEFARMNPFVSEVGGTFAPRTIVGGASAPHSRRPSRCPPPGADPAPASPDATTTSTFDVPTFRKGPLPNTTDTDHGAMTAFVPKRMTQHQQQQRAVLHQVLGPHSPLADETPTDDDDEHAASPSFTNSSGPATMYIDGNNGTTPFTQGGGGEGDTTGDGTESGVFSGSPLTRTTSNSHNNNRRPSLFSTKDNSVAAASAGVIARRVEATTDHLVSAFHLLRTQLSPLSDAKRLELVAVLAGAWRLPKPTKRTGPSDRILMTIICRSAPVAYVALNDEVK